MKQKLLLALLLSQFCLIAVAETEPNNTIAEANTLAHNGSQTGTLTGTDTEDWYVINIPQGGIFTLTVNKTGAWNGTLYLYDGEKAGNPELTNMYLSFGDSPAQGWKLTIPLLAGRYYAKFLKSSDPVNYTVNASLATPAYPEDTEANDTMSTALNMPVNGTVSGILHYYKPGKGYDNKDWYKLTVPAGGILQIKYSKKGSGNSYVYFRDGKKTGNNEEAQVPRDGQGGRGAQALAGVGLSGRWVGIVRRVHDSGGSK